MKIIGPRGYRNIDVFLDEGSTATLIKRNIALEVGADGVEMNVVLNGIGGSTSANQKVDLSLKSETAVFTLNNVLVVDNLRLPCQEIDEDLSRLCLDNAGVYISPRSSVPSLLIGQDHINLIIPREVREIYGNSLYVSQCLLGWAIHGFYDIKDRDDETVYVNSVYESLVEQTISNDSLDKLVRFYFGIDEVERFENNNNNVITENEQALEILNETSRYVNGSWEVGLLWKSNEQVFANGRLTALRRLFIVESKIDSNPEFGKLYYREMSRLIENGFAVKTGKNKFTNRTRYLPHFGVTNVNKPGKVRLVFDAAAKTESKSFNDLLLTGPDLLESLPCIIMRFRQFSFAIKADMKDMFLKIKIREQDQNAQRFLWRGENRTDPPEEFLMSSMIFGAKSSPCTALYIKNKNADLFMSKYPKSAKSVIQNCYMDDFLDSCETREEAQIRVREVNEINAHANWEMHSWCSNDATILEDISGENAPEQLVNSNSFEFGGEKLLGLRWFNHSDKLGFNVNFVKIDRELLDGTRKPKKREFLTVIMSIFDPLGFLIPFTIHSRILMQKVWLSGVDWDEEIRDEEFTKWRLWLNDLKFVKTCQVSRCYQLKGFQQHEAELHVFCDASKEAYTAVAYWRFTMNDNTFHTSIIAAKSRVVSKKVKNDSTIPRLELQAAVLGTKLAKNVVEAHDFLVKRRVLWSDSTTVLQWIRRDPKEFKIFVANRVKYIRENSNFNEWRYVPSKKNPADDGTRFAPGSLNEKSRWFQGPSFLREIESEWPNQNILTSHSKINHDVSQEIFSVEVINNFENRNLIDFSRFSSWLRAIYNVVRVLIAVARMRKHNILLTDLRFKAEEVCIRVSQQNSFPEESKALREGKNVPNNSKLLNLDPCIDEKGILRVNGRLTNFRNEKGELIYQPIILNSKENFTLLLIKHFHEKYLHGSHDSVLNELRQEFWIMGLRQALRSIVFKCSICRMIRGKPANPQMGALPIARVAHERALFTHCGVDYFGPMMIKIGRRREKRWGVLITCLTVRAIHIDIAERLDADSAIMVFERFMSLRGTPLVAYSDCGPNFKGMCSELKEVIIDLNKCGRKFEEFAARNKFYWSFNPPAASHMGGAWERLIQSVKTAISVALKEQVPREETLRTILAKITHSVNSRPLTHVSLDPRDAEALTPNHFLMGSSTGVIRFSKDLQISPCTRRQWKICEYVTDVFWKRWLQEYLPTLIPRKRWSQRESDPIKVGDIVLILDDQAPRNQWRKGVVIKVYPGQDQQVRTADVRTAQSVLPRPTRKLVKFSQV